MSSNEERSSSWRRRIRGGRKISTENLQASWPTHDTDELESHAHVIEAESIVDRALGRWATSAGLYGDGSKLMGQRTSIHGREVIKLLAAAAREELDQAA